MQLLDEIASEIGLEAIPVTWPVGDGPDFAGVVDRDSGELTRFDRTADGASVTEEQRLPVEEQPPPAVSPARWQAALEELELLDLDLAPLERDAVRAGTQTPVFFGTALTNFGVRRLLEGFADLAPAPRPQATVDGDLLPVDAPFAAQVFKVQANMNPRHRDRVAFLRVNAGRFRRGMTATLARTGRAYQLKHAHQLFAAERATVDDAVAGDIVGVVNATDLQVGDTLHDPDTPAVAFPAIPTFAPERFARVRNRDSGRAKQFRRGLAQLAEEGVVHVLRRPHLGDQEPIFAGVGELQFDVAAWRITNEFGADVTLEPAPWQLAREIDPADADRLTNQRGTAIATDQLDRTIVLFTSDHALQWAQQDHPGIAFRPLGLAPDRPHT